MPLQSSTGGSADTAPRSEPGSRSGGKAGDLRARVLSALVLGPLVLAAVYVGGWAFHLLIIACALIAVGEWVRLVEPDGALPFVGAILAMGGVLVSALVIDTATALEVTALATMALYLVLAAAGQRERGRLTLGLPYVAVGTIALIELRQGAGAGLGLFCYLLLVIWATDIGAYAAGRTIGGPKLAPRISPKKTWAGLGGAMVSAAIVGGGVAMAVGAARPWLAAGLGAVLAVVGQGGDLFESAVKRRYNVKDSGRLIPGHGGLLDRIDGLIVAAPVLALFHAVLGAWVAWW